MPGAIIPDDWDGVSFNCQKVIWPSSVRWRAILLGQLTEAERVSFWDEDFGVVADAVQAIEDAEALTLPGFWTEDCDVIPGHPVVAFLAYTTSVTTVFADEWKTIVWHAVEYSYNSPGIDLPTTVHYPVDDDHVGLWHYDAQLTFTPGAQYWVAQAVEEDANLQLARVDQVERRCNLSFDYDWNQGGTGIVIRVYSSGAGSLPANRAELWFSGHYLGEVS